MNKDNNDSHRHPKTVTITVNGRSKTETERTASFDEIIHLAFGAVDHQGTVYTVTYFHAHKKKEEGLVQGQTVKLEDGMVFTVVRTTKS